MDETLPGWSARHAAARPDRIAIRGSDEILTWRDFEARITSFADLLAGELACGAGTRVAYLGANTPDELALLFACAATGCVLVPLNWRLAPAELDAVLADCAPAVLFVEASCAPLASALRAAPRCVPCGRGAEAGGAPRTASRPARPRGITADSPLLLCYTSGTTGRAKGAVLTTRTIVCNAWNAEHMHDLSDADRVLTVLPLFHVGGLNIQTLPALRAGAEVILLPRFDPAATLAAIPALRPTLTVQVPATLQALQALPAWATTDLSSLRAVTTGSTDVPRHLIDAWHARGVPVIQVYGATETGPVTIYQRIAEARTTAGAIGRCGLHTEVRLVRADGSQCGPGEPGEIQVRGAHVIARYWRDANPEAFSNGWFRTGDVAQRDGAGVYWFKDRLRNVIISGGENIYPAEIERVLEAHPHVREAAVVGRADARWGAVPIAVVVPAVAPFDPAVVRAALAERLARYKWPQAFIAVDALPRTVLGKVDRAAVRRMADGASLAAAPRISRQ